MRWHFLGAHMFGRGKNKVRAICSINEPFIIIILNLLLLFSVFWSQWRSTGAPFFFYEWNYMLETPGSIVHRFDKLLAIKEHRTGTTHGWWCWISVLFKIDGDLSCCIRTGIGDSGTNVLMSKLRRDIAYTYHRVLPSGKVTSQSKSYLEMAP